VIPHQAERTCADSAARLTHFAFPTQLNGIEAIDMSCKGNDTCREPRMPTFDVAPKPVPAAPPQLVCFQLPLIVSSQRHLNYIPLSSSLQVKQLHYWQNPCVTLFKRRTCYISMSSS
jgi:hypothetical protein